jgi:HAMP domain-containing protein/CheY-like chemotaxis protein/signal transduction histidine kinase
MNDAFDLPFDKKSLLTVLTAFKKGDFSARLPLDLTGVNGKIADAFNEGMELNQRMAIELGRISWVVGKEGKLSQRANIGAVTGSWESSVQSVNTLIEDLVHPTSETARVIGAVAKGDLSQTMTLEIEGRQIEGEFLRTAKTVNTMVNQLGSFASEVTRVAREVGTEGKLGGQAQVVGVAGTWKDLTDSVNFMANNLTGQVRNIVAISTAIAAGDLSKKVTVDVKGEVLDLKNTMNTMIDKLNSFASEVTRVAREVGTEGKLGGQADVKGVGGIWNDLTENVNLMASNLTGQVRNITAISTAIAAGDLSKKITVDVKGEILELKVTINTMVDKLNSFASEVTRVAREVGTEGKLGGQADVKGVGGIWNDLTENVNLMASNLTGQVRDITAISTAIAAGDLSKKITVDVKGEILEFKNTMNTMVDKLSSFASEVTRVAREVGTEGKLGGQAVVKGVGGIWNDLTENVNSMASNLTGQVRNIVEISTAIAAGDLSKKITVDVKGEILELKVTINTMVDKLNSFASEVTRVAREVGSEGKLGGQADVKGVGGIWNDLTQNVNLMASNLTGQVRNITEISTAIAAGDLSKKITVDVKGEIFELKNTMNTMVDKLNSFASEVTRVAREVGTEGKLGGQADVKGVGGIWNDLTKNVNLMASNLTGQVRNITTISTAIAAGDLSKKITVDVKGEILELKVTINTMVDKLNSFASEVTRVAREVGSEGKLGGQADVKGVGGIWNDLTENVNLMASNLTGQVRDITAISTAIAAGDLSKKITVDVKGEILEFKNTMNTMIDKLSSFASEVTRVAREVGTEGKLGGQADVKGVGGIWNDLTKNVNSMAGNLTSQVRGIAKVVTAVANGDLKRKLTVEAKGEIAELADTINGMTETLAIFTDQVTTVAREVGVEGKLGGQASVPGASGTWKDLTDNVNQLAANLTTQVRALAEVATAVTKGDLTRSISVAAQGEVAALKDNINEMIRNLKDTTLKNSEQDWLKTNLAKFSRMLQGQKDLLAVGKLILSELAPVVSAQQAVFYTLEASKDDVTSTSKEDTRLKLLASYAYTHGGRSEFRLGEGLVGQCAVEKEKIILSNVTDDYIKISSGLGETSPHNIMILPVLFEGQVKAVMELASFERFSPSHEVFLDQLTESIGIVLNTIEANMRTEDLLKQAQSSAKELQSQQQELQTTNKELAIKAKLLADQNVEVERKNQEVEQSRSALEEKAKQLALTSKYKSEFLANMSHELRTPLNSLLILSDQMSRNLDGNLTDKQIEYSKTIHGSGNDLLSLINDILDLSKIESGTVTVEAEELPFVDLKNYVERNFRHVAESRSLEFDFVLDKNLPKAIHTDAKRLQQIIKNLLSNSFKFTHHGKVEVRVTVATAGWNTDNESLNKARSVMAFSVSDTGIGISPDKQRIIFEAFQQADGSTSRKYGGTGLGLAISREISRLLGGEIRLESAPNVGSTFILYLPRAYVVPKSLRKQSTDSDDHSQTERLLLEAQVAEEELTKSSHYSEEMADDRKSIRAGDLVLIIVDNDATFAKYVFDYAHQKGFKALVTSRGSTAIYLAREYRPTAIILDIKLPDINGWRVLNNLKGDLKTRHIPVHVMTNNENHDHAYQHGAVSFLMKPISNEQLDQAFSQITEFANRKTRNLLVIEDNDVQRNHIIDLVGGDDVSAVAVSSGTEALNALKNKPFDCVIMDLGLVDMTGFQLVETMRKSPSYMHIPIVVHTGRDLTKKEDAKLRPHVRSILVKDFNAPVRLLDVTTLCMHRMHDHLSEDKRAILEVLHKPEAVLVGKKILVVDDDIRNIFAMTGLLERFGVHVISAENGRSAIEVLDQSQNIDCVLMDIMMPEMDGYDTMRAIRKKAMFNSLPIIALTAKAMKGDREKCIEAGASDYIAKPVNTERLLSVLCVWLYHPNVMAAKEVAG